MKIMQFVRAFAKGEAKSKFFFDGYGIFLLSFSLSLPISLGVNSPLNINLYTAVEVYFLHTITFS